MSNHAHTQDSIATKITWLANLAKSPSPKWHQHCMKSTFITHAPRTIMGHAGFFNSCRTLNLCKMNEWGVFLCVFWGSYEYVLSSCGSSFGVCQQLFLPGGLPLSIRWYIIYCQTLNYLFYGNTYWSMYRHVWQIILIFRYCYWLF